MSKDQDAPGRGHKKGGRTDVENLDENRELRVVARSAVQLAMLSRDRNMWK
jgi:hypothetical protein